MCCSQRFSYKATLEVWNCSTNLINVDTSSKAPSTASSIEWFHRRNLSPLKDLVQAPVTSTAHKWVAFIHHRSVDTIRQWTAWCFIVSSAIALRDLLQLSTMNFNISYWYICLHRTAKSGSNFGKIILIIFTSDPEQHKSTWHKYNTNKVQHEVRIIVHALTCLYGGGFLSSRGSS